MVNGSSVKCLVVDDDHDSADVVGEFLRIAGAEVLVAYSGQEAIDVAPHFQPRMVVLDINMPVMDGFETFSKLGLQQWSSEAVFIAYTGMPRPASTRNSRRFRSRCVEGRSPRSVRDHSDRNSPLTSSVRAA
jgi:CheY-like chemotaxis protein